MKTISRSALTAMLASAAVFPAVAASHVDAAKLTCAQLAALNSDDQMAALHVLTEMSGEMATDEMSSDDAMESDNAMESDDAMASDAHTLDAVISNCTANPGIMAMDAVELG